MLRDPRLRSSNRDVNHQSDVKTKTNLISVEHSKSCLLTTQKGFECNGYSTYSVGSLLCERE